MFLLRYAEGSCDITTGILRKYSSILENFFVF